MKNFVANLPIYFGLVLRKISDSLFNLSFKLHITFKTEAGLKLEEINKTIAAMKDLVKTQSVPIQKQESPDRKLVNILNGSNNDKPTIANFSKKPNKLNN